MLISLLNNEIDEQTYLNEYNARYIYKQLPKKIYGFVIRYRNINVIVINYNLSDERKKKTLLHEFAHVELNHLDKKKYLLDFKIENIEDEADKYINFILDNI